VEATQARSPRSEESNRDVRSAHYSSTFLEPLLQAIVMNLKDIGAFVGPEEAEHQIGFPVQAYADDVIFIPRTVFGMKRMLNKLEEFAR
jgi:hypothetical protein